MKPQEKPANPHFSSGPTAKRPGWEASALDTSTLGRSHRATPGRAQLREVITRSKAILGIPADYRVGIVPGSDTGAFEMALWTLLGATGVDLLSWESFGAGWVTDVTKQLKLDDVRHFSAPYGELPDLSALDDPSRDVVFTWNGTTSGVRVPDGEWLSGRSGLALCDATSAAFAMPLPWDELDVVTWSWQKVMGGEAAHGMIALSPRAVARLESWTPPWPLPKLFRLTKGGALMEDIFDGATINTPSMLAVADQLDALAWAESIGGLPALVARCDANFAAVAAYVEASNSLEFLARDPACRSTTSICLSLADSRFTALDDAGQAAAIKQIVSLLETESVALDIAGYRDAPPGLRIWGGATVEASDVAALMPWIGWATEQSLGG